MASQSKSPGSAKRKDAPHSDRSNQKRADVRAARAIPAQEPRDALKDGELDLQAFVAAHEFEIRSLEQSMATSKAAGMSRAFQKVPRALRRRTANHNAKRMPKRLRSRAMKEMEDQNTPSVEARRRRPRTTRARIRIEAARRVGILAARKKRRKTKTKEGQVRSGPIVTRQPRPKIRKNAINEPPRPPAKFRKRQLNKTWLPTHAWHAKRARMTEPKNPLWRFAVPLTPNEKIYRPTHRAQGARGAVLWDMSYISTIGLYGNSPGMERIMKRLGVPDSCWNVKGRRWRVGTRSWTGPLSKETKEGRRQIAPATILWDPTKSDEEKGAARRALFRVHPSAFLELFYELLRLAKMETPQLFIEDLRFEIGSVDITGPASTEALQSVIIPYITKKHPESKHAELWKSLSGLTNPSSLPPSTILSFSAQDPRLRYPPKRVNVSEDPDDEMKLLTLLSTWPAEEGLQPYGLFDRKARLAASQLPTQSTLNRRRSNASPGSFLKLTSIDPPIPIILLASRSGADTQTQGTWTLVAPWKCITAFWYSLVRCPLLTGANPRFAGLNEIRQVAFERGQPWFPADFMTTDAGAAWEAEQRAIRKKAWEKRPKSKRVAWNRLDLGAGRRGEVGDGLACDFEYLLGLNSRKEKEPEAASSSAPEEDAMDVDSDSSKKEPVPLVEDAGLLKLLNGVSKADFINLVSSPNPTAPVPNAIASVHISILSRGVVGPCARIYRLPSPSKPAPTSSDAEVPATIPPDSSNSSSPPGIPRDLRGQWLARLPGPSSSKPSVRGPKLPKAGTKEGLEARKKLLASKLTAPGPWPPAKANETDINGHHPLTPDAEDLIGFVSTGSFNLAEGQGTAIGGIAVDKVLADIRADAQEGRLCVVRNAGENVGWLARWTVI